MVLDKAIKDFPRQFEYEPVIENTGNFKPADKFVVCGMGGSHLSADLIKTARPDLDIIIHSDYGLPQIGDLNERMVVVSSYSGNTEEALDSFEEAARRGFNLAAVSIGGKLLEEAKNKGVTFVKIPDTGIQPRMAVGFSVLALLKMMGEDTEISEIKKVAGNLGGEEGGGNELAKKLEGKVPIIYASEKNSALALNWKVIFNETGKIPAFWNAFPELNHNEMTGFDVIESAKKLSQNFAFVFLRDPNDHPRIIKRMNITQKILEDRGFACNLIQAAASIRLSSGVAKTWHKFFSSILIADWTAYYLALHYGVDPEQVPMVEEFKKMMA